MKLFFSIFLTIAILLSVGACNPTPPAPTSAPPSSTNQPEAYPEASAYPYPGAQQLEMPTPYPGQESAAYPAAEPTPQTVDPSLGQLTGVLTENGKPISGAYLYLAGIKTDAQGRELVAAFSASEDPFAITDAEGKFHFVNIPAGRYAMVLDITLNAFLLPTPGSEDPIILTVENGKTSDLGVLDYDELPIPDAQR